MVVERNRAVFTEAPTAVPDGNVDVSGAVSYTHLTLPTNSLV